MRKQPSSSLIDGLLNKAVQIPSSTIRDHVNRIQARNPEASPERIITLLEREYLRVVQATGSAVGAAAAIPAVGTGVAAALTGSNIATFFAASAAFTLAVADVHGIEVDDAARRRAFLLATLMGDEKALHQQLPEPASEFQAVGPALGAAGAIGVNPAYWGRAILTTMPTSTIKQVNKALTGKFLRGFLARQGGLAMGRMIPFGVGAGVGFIGARVLGHRVIAQSRKAFGPAPYEFGVPVRVIETGGSPLLIPDVSHQP